MAERIVFGFERIIQLGKALDEWGVLTKTQLQQRLFSLGLRQRIDLAQSIAVKPRKKGGEYDRVSVTFPRYGIFMEHGVGKYRPVRSPAALKARRPWLAPELPKATERLADLLSNEYADFLAEELRINIPGIYSTRITL